MEILKNRWFQLTTIILILLISYSFYWVIFHYPYWVKSQVTLINGHIKNASDINADLNEGTFGDMYGALNSIVSGLAFLGLLITIGVQIWLHYREQELKKKEKLDKAKNKLVYLDFLVKRSLSEIEAFKAGINDLMRDNSLEKKKSVFFKNDNTLKHNKINKIVNKIDQESFFTAYFQKYEKQDLDNLFVSFEELLKSWKSFIKKLRDYEVECDSELFKLRRAFNILQEKENKESKTFGDSERNGESIDSNTLKIRLLQSYYSPEIDILKDINEKNNQFEIYYTIKDKYELQIEENPQLQAQEYNDYVENCKKHIERIESIKNEIVELCKKQITNITNHEGDIKNVKIRES